MALAAPAARSQARLAPTGGSIVQCDEGVGVGLDDLQKRACGSGRADSVLFPVLQRLGFDADQVGEVGLAEACAFADRFHIRFREFLRANSRNGFTAIAEGRLLATNEAWHSIRRLDRRGPSALAMTVGGFGPRDDGWWGQSG